jgi:N-acetylmuramoyl-L-alanine amidase
VRAKLIILIVATVAVLAAGFAASRDGDDDRLDTSAGGATDEPSSTTSSSTVASTGTTARLPTTTIDGATAIASPGKPTILVTPTGAVTIVLSKTGSQYTVRTPCGGEARLSAGTVYGTTTVVLDPGHGGFDPGASTASGLTEADLNLDVAKKAKTILDQMGHTTVLTRGSDYYVPIQIRAEIAIAAAPKVFVSVHHNGGKAAKHDGPGTEVYHQLQSAPAKRLAGLMWEEIFNTFDKTYKPSWWGASDAGAIYRPDRDGRTDFFGVLRRTYPTIPAVLIEAGYMTNPEEASLMTSTDYALAEAQAIAAAVNRFLTTTDPGSGFHKPNDRGFETGTGGGGFEGCTEPKFS